MAYVVHITRKENWYDKTPIISKNEWDDLVAKKILEPTGIAEYPIDVYAKRKGIYFFYRSGDINSAIPNEEAINVVKEVAEFLGAKVQGDDLEIY